MALYQDVDLMSTCISQLDSLVAMLLGYDVKTKRHSNCGIASHFAYHPNISPVRPEINSPIIAYPRCSPGSLASGAYLYLSPLSRLPLTATPPDLSDSASLSTLTRTPVPIHHVSPP